MSEATKPVVKIFVRLGRDNAEDVRQISFRIPDGIDPLELLDRGFAIDGNQASFTVAPVLIEETGLEFRNPVFTDQPDVAEFDLTLTGALTGAQRAMVAYLRERGYAPQFA